VRGGNSLNGELVEGGRGKSSLKLSFVTGKRGFFAGLWSIKIRNSGFLSRRGWSKKSGD